MRERLSQLVIRPWMEIKGFAVATAIGLMARGSARIREDWCKTTVHDAFQNGGVFRWRRWSLLFFRPEDRGSVYKDIEFVLESAI